jgi:hypothetical protein
MDSTLIKTVELEYTVLDFYENYVVSKMRGGVVVSDKQVLDLIKVCGDYFEGENFVYISKRINQYNVDPTSFIQLKKIKNLAGIAVVSEHLSAINMAHFERGFTTIDYEIFLEEAKAIEWARNILKEKKVSL